MNQDVRETVRDIFLQLFLIFAALTAGNICVYPIYFLVVVVFRDVGGSVNPFWLFPFIAALIAWLITLVLPLTKAQKVVAILAFSFPAMMGLLLFGLR
ncbi:MAG: hypothetical protein V4671_23865 [Armatimonadota bacterium]